MYLACFTRGQARRRRCTSWHHSDQLYGKTPAPAASTHRAQCTAYCRKHHGQIAQMDGGVGGNCFSGAMAHETGALSCKSAKCIGDSQTILPVCRPQGVASDVAIREAMDQGLCVNGGIIGIDRGCPWRGFGDVSRIIRWMVRPNVIRSMGGRTFIAAYSRLWLCSESQRHGALRAVSGDHVFGGPPI